VEPLTAHFPSLQRDLFELLAQLQANDTADFGRVARRSSEPTERLLEVLWLERQSLAMVLEYEPTGNAQSQWPLEESVTHCVRRWLDWLYDQNQFFELTPQQTEALRHAHRLLFRSVQASLDSCEDYADFARHCQLSFVHYAERLSRILRAFSAPEGLRGRGAEYSPELQLKLLGLEEHSWLGPIVDLGCGVDGRLVHYLRERGLDATGVERRSGSQFVLAKDWFDVRFEPNSIGTLLSHLAFSLQFLHHHWHPGERAYAFARKYVELLRSLRPGGMFCYAPGLPFIESILEPNEYEVTTLPLPEPLATTIGSLRDIGTGQSVAYACQIRRRGPPAGDQR